MKAIMYGIAFNIPKREALDDTPALDQQWNLRRSFTGTPSISAMIVVGIWRA